MKSNIIKLLAVMVIIGLAAATGAIAGEKITGTVEKTDAGIVLNADDGNTYIVMGKDLTEMVDKTVNVTGTVAEGKEGKKILTVLEFEAAPAK